MIEQYCTFGWLVEFVLVFIHVQDFTVFQQTKQHNATQYTSLHLKFLTRKAKQVGARAHNTYHVYYNLHVKQKPLLRLWHETENKLNQKKNKGNVQKIDFYEKIMIGCYLT